MKRIFVVLASMLFGVCNTYCSQGSMSRGGALFEKYYRGDPHTDNARLYVYLCRHGTDPTEEKCKCATCCGDISGLYLGFICVDEANGEEFSGIGPSTNNILWSMYVAFSGKENIWSGCRLKCRGALTASYCYNPAEYSQIEGLDAYGRVFSNNGFLHDEEEQPCAQIDPLGEVVLHKKGEGTHLLVHELSVTRILRTALFRVKFPSIDIPTVSDVLMALGGIGEKRQDRFGQDIRVLVPYSKGGVIGHNCATFCRAALHELSPLPTIKWHIKPVPAVASGIAGFGGAALAGGSIGSMICPGIGTGVGIAAGVVVEAAAMAFTSIAKVVSANTPAAVVDMVLDYFQEKYEKGDAVTRQIIDSFFSVVAQDRSKFALYKGGKTPARFDPNDYRELMYKTMKDVVTTGVRIKKTKEVIFFKEDFEKKPDSGCSIM